MKASCLTLSFVLSIGLLLAPVGCQEEGPAEKMGRALDETADRIRYGDEGTLEKAGRKMDEAIEEAEEEQEERKR
jgi:hypothetical protein